VGFGDRVTPGWQFWRLGWFSGRSVGWGDWGRWGGRFADIIRIGEVKRRLEVVRMEFGSLVALVGDVSKDNGTTRMATGNHFEVSCGEDRSLKFGIITSNTNVNVVSLGKVPQDAGFEAGIEPTVTVSLLIIEVPHCGGIEFDVSVSVNIDKNGLALTVFTELVAGCFREHTALSLPDVEYLNVIVLRTWNVRCCPLLIDGSSGREAGPILGFLFPDLHHVFVFTHIVIGILIDSTIGLPFALVGGASLVDNVTFHVGSLVENLDISPGDEVSTHDDAVATRVGKDVGTHTDTHKVSGSVSFYGEISHDHHVTLYLGGLDTLVVTSDKDGHGIVTTRKAVPVGTSRDTRITLFVVVGISGGVTESVSEVRDGARFANAVLGSPERWFCCGRSCGISRGVCRRVSSGLSCWLSSGLSGWLSGWVCRWVCCGISGWICRGVSSWICRRVCRGTCGGTC